MTQTTNLVMNTGIYKIIQILNTNLNGMFLK